MQVITTQPQSNTKETLEECLGILNDLKIGLPQKKLQNYFSFGMAWVYSNVISRALENDTLSASEGELML